MQKLYKKITNKDFPQDVMCTLIVKMQLHICHLVRVKMHWRNSPFSFIYKEKTCNIRGLHDQSAFTEWTLQYPARVTSHREEVPTWPEWSWPSASWIFFGGFCTPICTIPDLAQEVKHNFFSQNWKIFVWNVGCSFCKNCPLHNILSRLDRGIMHTDCVV